MALKFRYPRQIDKPATLLDRLGMAVLSAVIAFLTGLAIWALIAIGPYGSGFALPFGLVVWFTAVMAGLGFLTAESLLVTIFGKVWFALHVLFSGQEPPNHS